MGDVGTSQPLSMTGFGTSELSCEAGVLRVELRAVNHRALDVRVRTSPELADFGTLVEELVRADCQRGRIEASLKLVTVVAAAEGHALAPFRAAFVLLSQLRDELMPEQPLSIDTVVRFASDQRRGAPQDATFDANDVRQVTREAIERLQAMRATEGAALCRDLRARVASLRNQVTRIADERPGQLDAYGERVQARVRKLLEGAGVELDSARLTQEIAWLAERSDVAEELTRLESHLEQFEHSVSVSEGAGVGRKLEFLVQEMGREVNTLGSKAADAATAHRVVDMKAELDRIREQVANIL